MRKAWARTDYERRLDAVILAPAALRDRGRRLAQGRPGEDTITALLGSLVANLRRDRVVAVDANPDFDSLGRRLVPSTPSSSTTCSSARRRRPR